MTSRPSAGLLAVFSICALVFGPLTVATADPLPDPGATGSDQTAGRRLALGVSMLPDRDLANLDSFSASVGRHPAIWTLWSSWGDESGAFPDPVLLGGLDQRGVIPMVNWQPVDPADPGSPRYRYQAVARGDHDAYLRAFAASAREWGHPLLLRFAFEMNGPWFPWSIERFGNTAKAFRRAWRHVVDVFRGPGGERATNVRFIWSVYVPCEGCRPIDDLYPGDRWVDFVAFDAFEWRHPDRPMARLYETGVRRLRALTDKRILVTETGVSHAPADKAEWISRGYPEVYRRLPRIVAIVYFNIEGAAIGEPEDWRFTTSPESLDAYRAIASRPRFQGTLGSR